MNNKKRLITVLKLLKENTNYQHCLTAEQIITHLEKEGFECERKTIYSDVKQLDEMGYSIEKTHDGYYYDGQVLQDSEIKILVDYVNSAQFISKKRAKELTEKLLGLTNVYSRQLIDEDGNNANKTENDYILYNIDTIMKAIKNNHQAITFDYFDYNIDRNKVYRKNHDYRSYPYKLVSSDGKYYLICYSLKHQELTNYRIDKMENVNTINKFKFEEIDLSDYMSEHFHMYKGETKNITLKCDNALAGEILSHFADKAIIQEKHDKYFVCNVNASATSTFYSWIISYSGKIKIVAPQEVKDDLVKKCQEFIDEYK